MAEPTLIDYQQSTWTDNSGGASSETTPSMSWNSGDVVLVVGATEDQSSNLATPTSTGSGLSFSLLTSANGVNNTRAYMWSATASATSSGTISSAGDNAGARGIAAFIFRSSDGLGTPQSIEGLTDKTISLTRTGANSHVVAVLADWNAVSDTTVDATPTGTVRVAAEVAGRATFFVTSYGDQGGTGTTSYGITNHTGTVDMSGIVVEILGTSGGGRTTKNTRSAPLGIEVGMNWRGGA